MKRGGGGKKKTAANLSKDSDRQESPRRYPHLHCQLLNEVRQGADPGFSLSGYSAAMHAPEVSWVGPAFPRCCITASGYDLVFLLQILISSNHSSLTGFIESQKGLGWKEP